MDHINPDGKDLEGVQHVQPALLHLYSPPFYHAEAYIVGNHAGLVSLRDTLNRVLEGDDTCSFTPYDRPVFVKDGEGYQVIVILENSDWQGPTWDNMAFPYTDERMCGHLNQQKGVIWPTDLMQQEDWNRIFRRLPPQEKPLD